MTVDGVSKNPKTDIDTNGKMLFSKKEYTIDLWLNINENIFHRYTRTSF